MTRFFPYALPQNGDIWMKDKEGQIFEPPSVQGVHDGEKICADAVFRQIAPFYIRSPAVRANSCTSRILFMPVTYIKMRSRPRP